MTAGMLQAGSSLSSVSCRQCCRWKRRAQANHQHVQSTATSHHHLSSRVVSPRVSASTFSSRYQCARSCLRSRMITVATQANPDQKIGVLFVCLGNICRSPTAEAVFRFTVEKRGLSNMFNIDSCGTGGGAAGWWKEGGFSYHEGDPADPRMTAAARKRGVTLTSRSRPLQPEDTTKFDYIIGMDASNKRAIAQAVQEWGLSKDIEGKLSLLGCYHAPPVPEVPDPYYGGEQGFEDVLDLVQGAADNLLDKIVKEKGLVSTVET